MKFWREIAIVILASFVIAICSFVKNLNDDAIANEYKFVNIHNELMTITTSLEVIHSKLDKSEFYNYKETSDKMTQLNIELLQKEIDNVGGNNGK